MKDYAIPISLVGAALIIVGGLAYLISPDTGSTGLVNATVGLLLVVSAGFINANLFRQYGRWLNAFWGGIMVFGIVAMINFLSNRYAERLDLTEGQLHSLSDLTIETLQKQLNKTNNNKHQEQLSKQNNKQQHKTLNHS